MKVHKIRILAKEGCHLCERAIDTLRDLSNPNFELQVTDITLDQMLFEKYFLKIPVVQVDGRDVYQVEQIALPEDCRRNLQELVSNLQ